MVLKFEDYINEGLVNKTLKRVRMGDKRIEARTPLDELCKFVGNCIAKKFKIEPSSKLCHCEKMKPDTDSIGIPYEICLDLSLDGEYPEYEDVRFEFEIDEHMSGGRIWFDFSYALDIFQDGMEYEEYRDPELDSRKHFNKIKRTLESIVGQIRNSKYVRDFKSDLMSKY